jgi:hypothetical protein
MIGGGYHATDVFEYALFVHGNYPSDAMTWTVMTDSISNYFLSISAYCLQGAPAMGLHIVAGSTCPLGNVLTSSGFNEQQPFVICASQHVIAGTKATQPLSLNSQANGYTPQDGSVQCLSGQFALGGGATAGTILESETNASFTGWNITAGGSGDGEIYADCLMFTSRP